MTEKSDSSLGFNIMTAYTLKAEPRSEKPFFHIAAFQWKRLIDLNCSPPGRIPRTAAQTSATGTSCLLWLHRRRLGIDASPCPTPFILTGKGQTVPNLPNLGAVGKEFLGLWSQFGLHKGIQSAASSLQSSFATVTQ